MVEGGSSRNFENAKRMMHGEPEVFSRLLERVVDVSIPYLAMQVEDEPPELRHQGRSGTGLRGHRRGRPFRSPRRGRVTPT